MTKQNIRCDACGCAFVPEPQTQREGEIEYSYFNCDYCCKAYMVSVTDAAEQVTGAMHRVKFQSTFSAL